MTRRAFPDPARPRRRRAAARKRLTAGPRGRFDGRCAVAAAFAVAMFGWGLGFYGPPVYLEAVLRERGWPVALVSGAVTAHFLAGVATIAALPRLHRRFGLAAITAAGAIVLAAGVEGWALARSPAELYAAALVSGAGWPALGAVAINAIVSPWFVARRPAALGMAYNGASVGGAVFAPLWTALIAGVGFPTAALLVGAGTVAAVGALAASALGRTPENTGQRPDGAPPEPAAGPRPALPMARRGGRFPRDRAFATLSLGMALALFAQVGLVEQLVSLLAPALGAPGAGSAAGLATAAAVAGRLAVGALLPPGGDRRRAAALSLMVQAAGCCVLASAGEGAAPALLLGTVLLGLGVGNATSLPPLIAQAEFAGDAPAAVAAIVATSQAAYAFAPAAFGLMRGAGVDRPVALAAGALQLTAAAVYLWGRRRPAA